MNKTYLGDGIYIKKDPGGHYFTITTENGIEATNTIIFGPEELSNLLQWLEENTKNFTL